jgi:hypothetical protein
VTAYDDLPGASYAEILELIPAFIVVAIDATGLGIILPLLPFYSQRLGATPFIGQRDGRLIERCVRRQERTGVRLSPPGLPTAGQSITDHLG